jgi:hopanoid biosynthesis associated protein HpnK
LPRLIINADDFGLTPGVNRAIAEAHANGIVTSATLMANGRAFTDAVELAKRNLNLSVGCHVVLVDGEPLLPPSQISTLVTKDSRFPTGFGAIAQAALRKKLRSEEIEAEVTAQIRRIQNAGITVAHVDSHKHVHMLPPVGAAMIRAARACGVRAIRNPFVPVKPLAVAHLTRRPQLWKRYAQTKILRRYEYQFLRQVADAGMLTTDGSFGVISTGSLDAKLFSAVIGSIPDGTWEFVCHPGYIDKDLGTIRTRLRESREKELAVLTSEDARSAIADRHIELISYADLAANPRR